jgi:hypothetical protein
MRKLHLLLIIAALWNALPATTPLRPLFELVLQDPTGDITATADPDVDPIVISLPPPR